MKEKVGQGTYVGGLVDIFQGLHHRGYLALQRARRRRVKSLTSQGQARSYLASIGQVPVHAVVVERAEAVAARGSVRDKTGLRASDRHLVPK